MLRQRAAALSCALLTQSLAGGGTLPTAARKARPAPMRPGPGLAPQGPVYRASIKAMAVKAVGASEVTL